MLRLQSRRKSTFPVFEQENEELQARLDPIGNPAIMIKFVYQTNVALQASVLAILTSPLHLQGTTSLSIMPNHKSLKGPSPDPQPICQNTCSPRSFLLPEGTV